LTALELRVEVRPPWPFRLGGGSADGLARRRGHALQRLLRIGGEPVLVGVVQPARDRVLFAARAAGEAAAREAIARMRFATGVDDDLRPFYDRFRDDPVIGRAVRARPELRVRRRPVPWEALAAAVTEQLIEFERAVAIQRRLIAALGYRCPATGLRDGPPPAAVAGLAPARLASFDLAPKRAIALRRVAHEVASGRADLDAAAGLADGGAAVPAGDRAAAAERALRRLLSIPEIGPWTVEMLALHGLGRFDMVPAGDLGYVKLVGRLRTGNPQARAEIGEVREFFARYGDWQGLAGEYLRAAAASGLLTPGRSRPGPAPRPAGTRWSARVPRSAAA
jgi:3-methyladenine DNA glycosylase/8-oxoguanine DNA glycosylase